jgi:hypothetical protein
MMQRTAAVPARRLERCRASLHAAHAELGLGLAIRMAGRIAPSRCARLYARAMGLSATDADWLVRRVRRTGRDFLRDPAVRHDGLLRFRDWLRIHGAPWGNAGLQAELAAALTDCRRALAVIAARHAFAAARELAGEPVPLHTAAACLEDVGLPPEIHAVAFNELVRRQVSATGRKVLSGSRVTVPRLAPAARAEAAAPRRRSHTGAAREAVHAGQAGD